MRRQWACSKCGFACSSSWRSVIYMNLSAHDHQQRSTNSSLNNNKNNNMHEDENVCFSVNQIGMIFGNLCFEPTPTTSIPALILPKIKSEVVDAEDSSTTHRFDCGGKSRFSKEHISRIHIKQEYDSCEQTVSKAGGNKSIWEANKVHKKKRSKLPQYALSPLARFINQLQCASCYRPRYKNKHPKYDDVLIYEKCKFVAEDEVGLGAKLLSPPVFGTKSTVMIKEECSSTS